jgi:hypothetical protein
MINLKALSRKNKHQPLSSLRKDILSQIIIFFEILAAKNVQILNFFLKNYDGIAFELSVPNFKN